MVVHEWAKLRWGVFEEYGYPGDAKFPMFYLKTTWGANGQEDVLKPNFCTSTEVEGESRDLTTGGECKTDPESGLPDANCYFPKFCIGFKIRKSRSEQLLLSGSGHSK